MALVGFGGGLSEQLGVRVQNGLVGQPRGLVLDEAHEESQLTGVELRYPVFPDIESETGSIIDENSLFVGLPCVHNYSTTCVLLWHTLPPPPRRTGSVGDGEL